MTRLPGVLERNETAADFALGIVAGMAAFSADFIVFGTPYVDSQITMELVARYDLAGVFTRLPIRQPHYPTWYVIPEVLGRDATLVLNEAFFVVSALFVTLAARELYGSYFSQYFAAALVAFSPFMATQAGWLRMYAPLSALVAAAVYFKITDRPAAVFAVSLAAAAVHPFGIFVAGWSALWLWSRGSRRPAAALAVTPMLWAFIYVAVNYFAAFRAGAPMTIENGLSYTGGAAPGPVMIVAAPLSSLTGSPVDLSHMLLLLAVAAVVLAHRPRPDLLLLIVGSVLGIAVGSYILMPVFKLKYMAIVSPVVALVLADDSRPARAQAAVVAGVALLYLVGWVYRYERALNIRRFVFELPGLF